jgi:hypothetical protein
MANIKPEVPLITEQFGTKEDLIKGRLDAQKLLLKKEFEERQKQEKALAEFTLKLQGLTLKQIQKRQMDFLKEYEKTREKEERKRLVDYFKESSKLALDAEKKKQKQLDDEYNFYKKIAELRAQGQGAEADRLEVNKAWGESFKEAGKNILKGLVNIADRLGGEVNSIISTFSQYQSSINTRLQGTATTFQSIQSNLTRNAGIGPFVRTSNLLENLNNLVAQGISFNLEQRAFLETISDKISTTFDVADASLLRIVKLQQQDSSAARLGLEAYLTRFFNNMFQDTQYLSQSFDTVTAALVEATSLMGAKQSVEFEYIVQKWLGSLSAVGTSESTIQSLAQAIGFLGAGNVTALSGSNMQNLLVMAASRAGLDYSSILTEGLNAFSTNQLLQAVVGYMQEIGQSGNKVVKSQFAQTFGVSISDLQAAQNLNVDLEKISQNMMSYSGAISELGYQLNQVSTRTSIPEMIQNLLANVKFGIGQGIAENPAMAAIWELAGFSKSVTGGIKVPDVLAGGFGLLLNTTVEGLIQSGMIGLSALGKVGDVIGGIGKAFNMASLIQAFGFDREAVFEPIGTGLESRASGMSTSASLYAGTSSGAEIAGITSMRSREALMTPEQKRSMQEQKTSNDIFNYLVYMLDPKLTLMSQLLGTMVGYSVGTTAGQNVLSKDTEYIMGYGTTVKTSQPAETQASKSYEKLDELSNKVASIHTILERGTLNVKVTNTSDFSFGVNTPAGA